MEASILQKRHFYLVAHQSQRIQTLRDDWLPPLPARHQAVLLCARAPCAETFPPVGTSSPGVGLPASPVGDAPVLLSSNPLFCEKPPNCPFAQRAPRARDAAA